MIYGDAIIHREKDITDRIGIRTLILSQIWQPKTVNPTQAQIDEEVPDAPVTPGGVLQIGQETVADGGKFRTRWTFEGVNGDGKNVTFRDRTNSLDYGFDPGFAQIPIIRHPSFDSLFTTWQGSIFNNDVFWPQYIAGGSQTGAAKGSAAGTANPMFGHNDFISIQGTYTYRYAVLETPVSPFPFNTIATPPGQPPAIPDRTWMFAAMPNQRRGLIFDVTEIYWLSDPGGWPDIIYSAAAMSGNGGNGASTGLTTGALTSGGL